MPRRTSPALRLIYGRHDHAMRVVRDFDAAGMERLRWRLLDYVLHGAEALETLRRRG